MKAFTHFFLFLTKIFQRLPFWILHIKSSTYFLLIFYVVRYRKKVVLENLQSAFPEKSLKELKKTRRQFYFHLCDLIFEIIIQKQIPEDKFLKRIQLRSKDWFEELVNKNEHVICSIGHQGNWEWFGSYLQLKYDKQCFAMVKPLSDPKFDDYLTKVRTRFGLKLIPFKQFSRYFQQVQSQPSFLIIAADQSPAKNDHKVWTSFMGQQTAFSPGLGKIAKKMNAPIIFFEIIKTKRSNYQLIPHLVCEEVDQHSEQEILEKYVSLLEQSIIRNPSHWLWSHRRWKHKQN